MRERVRPTATCACCGKHEVAVSKDGTLFPHASQGSPLHRCVQAAASAFRSDHCETVVLEGLQELLTKEAKVEDQTA